MKKHNVPLVEYVDGRRVVVGECEVEYDHSGVNVTLGKITLPVATEDVPAPVLPPIAASMEDFFLGGIYGFSIAEKPIDPDDLLEYPGYDEDEETHLQ